MMKWEIRLLIIIPTSELFQRESPVLLSCELKSFHSFLHRHQFYLKEQLRDKISLFILQYWQVSLPFQDKQLIVLVIITYFELLRENANFRNLLHTVISKTVSKNLKSFSDKIAGDSNV